MNGSLQSLESFALTLFALVALVVLTLTGDVDGSVSVPIISGIGGAATGAGMQKRLNGGPR